MSPKSLVLLAIALGCGLVASIAISQVIDGKNQAVVETVPIYVALQNINLGDPVDDAMVSLQEWPKDKVPLGAITAWEDIEDRRPRTAIFQGEPLLDGKFLERGQTQDPISSIPEGMRLKTVLVDARKSAAGLLSPGDRVDIQIFVHRNERENISHPFTKIILQNIRVFAVDQAVQRSADGTEARSVAKTVSLIVTPSQANKMTTAENLGELSLIPRHPDDDLIVDDAEQSADFLLGSSDSNSREKEQGLNRSGGDGSGVDGFDQAAAVEMDPPFRMKIIFPNEVAVREFSSETGEPLDSEDGESYRSVGDSSSESSDPADSFRGAVDSGSNDEDADFPIDLNQK
ncbi:MAG: Flp pilus assembly protein CpaB [Planctomycetes bacterium]|nr:Flp pilus assembly protein CpaB [Planctomycetota bacterium]